MTKTMRSRRFPLALLVLAVAAAVPAADFWTAKPYTEWTEKEVGKLMADSPWARPVKVVLTTKDAGGGGTTDEEFGPMDEGGTKMTLQVIWHSKTVRKAQARQRVLKGGAADEAKDKAFIDAAPADAYNVVLQGVGFTPLLKATEDELKAAAKLVVGKKGASREVLPASVAKPADAKGFVAIFTFPKGDTPVAAADGEVVFETKIGKYPIKGKFELADMTGDGGPDL